MSSYNQNQPQVSYPPHSQSQTREAPTSPPPPAGYPTMDMDRDSAATTGANNNTQSRGDGFWKGCCAALCCCCALDACF